MVRKAVLTAVLVAGLSGLVWAQASETRKVDCGHQAAVVAAVQQARLDRVRERKVQEHVTKDATWPDNYNNAIPLIAGWVYGKDVTMRDVRNKDLAAAWTELCLQQ
ncbi:MAG: hypothetical protein HKP51_10360 [Sulfitobacter sp.]|nr:hypothetical protein [Sulfitobacter sp.]